MDVFDAGQLVIRFALPESEKNKDSLQAKRVTKVAVISDSQAAI
jgi:hypothetical protein